MMSKFDAQALKAQVGPVNSLSISDIWIPFCLAKALGRWQVAGGSRLGPDG